MSTLRAVVIASALATSACAITLINGPVESKTHEWKLVLVKLSMGLDHYKTSAGYIEPVSGARFLWLDVRLTNETASMRWFNYENCHLDAGNRRVLPSIVPVGPDSEAPDLEKLGPRQEITRTLIFSYPDDQLPTRLQCGALLIPLKLGQSSNAPSGSIGRADRRETWGGGTSLSRRTGHKHEWRPEPGAAQPGIPRFAFKSPRNCSRAAG